MVEGKWCPGYLEDVWYVPDIGRHLFLVWSATEHGISVVMKVNASCFYTKVSLWQQDAYAMDMHIVIPREPAEVNIALASETLQLWHERLGHQEKHHV